LKPNQTAISFFSLLFLFLATIAFLTHSIGFEYFGDPKTARNDNIDSIFYLLEGTDLEYDIHDFYELGSSNLLSICIIPGKLFFRFDQIDFLRDSKFCAISPRSPPKIII
jgi:hypothetical protein